MNKPLFLFVGKSASGKTSVADMLKNKGYSQIYSYTTREPRYDGEIGHVFISDEEYDKLENIVASTVYNDKRYCTTLEQVQNADIYVVDVEGVRTLMSNYELLNRKIHIVLFEADTYHRVKRMIEREDSDTQIVGRLLVDEKDNWYEQLKEIKYLYDRPIRIHTVNANKDLRNVYSTVKHIIDKENGKHEEH